MDLFKGLSPVTKTILTWVIIIVVLIIVFIVAKQLYKQYLERKKNEIINDSQKTVTLPSGQTQSINLGAVALGIYDAFYNNDVFGASEDEQKAIALLSGVPKELIPDLSTIYFKLYGHNLREDYSKYLDSDEYAKISYLIG